MAAKYEAEIDRINRLSAAALADMVLQDAQLLRYRAADRGVTAYLDKPVHRERPNERFLQNTLRNGDSSNRRAQERTMWNARKAQLDLETGGVHHLAQRGRPRSPSPASDGRGAAVPQPSKRQRNGHSNGRASTGATRQRAGSPEHSSSDGEGSPDGSSADGEAQQHPEATQEEEEAAEEAERQLEELLSKSRVRGRGAVGPRADEPGPYLPASAAGMYSSDEDVTAPARPVLGPAAPAWARNGSTMAPQSSSAFVAALNAANVAAVAALRSPVRDEETAAKKDKHKRKTASSKKKAKQKHKRKRERDDG